MLQQSGPYAGAILQIQVRELPLVFVFEFGVEAQMQIRAGREQFTQSLGGGCGEGLRWAVATACLRCVDADQAQFAAIAEFDGVAVINLT